MLAGLFLGGNFNESGSIKDFREVRQLKATTLCLVKSKECCIDDALLSL